MKSQLNNMFHNIKEYLPIEPMKYTFMPYVQKNSNTKGDLNKQVKNDSQNKQVVENIQESNNDNKGNSCTADREKDLKLDFSSERMRQAILWSEILEKPVCKRRKR